MVGLSIVLEGQKSSVSVSSSSSSSAKKVSNNNNKNYIIVNKTNMIINNRPSSLSSCSLYGTAFLDHCFLCNRKLLPGKDIYMYRGDKAFCSVECRCKQILMDEEESKSNLKNNCALMTTINPSSSSSSSTSSSSSSSTSRHRKGTRNRAL